MNGKGKCMCFADGMEESGVIHSDGGLWLMEGPVSRIGPYVLFRFCCIFRKVFGVGSGHG